MNLSGARTTKAITDAAGNYRFSDVDTDASIRLRRHW